MIWISARLPIDLVGHQYPLTEKKKERKVPSAFGLSILWKQLLEFLLDKLANQLMDPIPVSEDQGSYL